MIDFRYTGDRLMFGFLAVVAGVIPAAMLATVIGEAVLPAWLIGGAIAVLIWARMSPDQRHRL